MNHLFWSIMIMILVSMVGFSYFMYGKRQSDAMFMLDGAALMVYTYIVPGLIPILLVGLILIAAPFVARRYF